jgi:tetraspanin-13/31
LSIILISVAGYALSSSIVATSIIGGLIFCGIFLLVISVIGLFGTLKHHQVLLFLVILVVSKISLFTDYNHTFLNPKYMFTLMLCFLIQFIIACVCLGIIPENSQTALLEVAWNKLDTETIRETQIKNNCCGFVQMNSSRVECPITADKPCVQIVRDSVAQALKTTGIIGLLFSFINVNLFFQLLKQTSLN